MTTEGNATKPSRRAQKSQSDNPQRGRPAKVVGDRVSRNQLHELTGYSKDFVYDNLKKPGSPKPDDDGLYDKEEAIAFLKACMARQSNEDILRFRAEGLRLDLEERETARKVRLGQLVDRQKIKPQIEQVMEKLTMDLQDVFERELPPKYKGKTVVECAELNAQAVDRVLRAMKSGWGSLT